MLEHIWFPEIILSWYKENQRELPWRKTRNAYKIWLSEIILQQTRVNQGLPYYHKFVDNYPTVHALASASEEEVLRLWQGLGYYSRARNLHRCAKIISEEKSGNFPESFSELTKLPGIGPYTAAAIASFSFQIPVAVVDGNVLRLLSRVFGMYQDIAKSHTPYRELANRLIPSEDPATFNQAIMEFGSIQCSPGIPDCEVCPLRQHCHAYKNNAQGALPVKSKKTKVRKRYFHYIVLSADEKIYMNQRGRGDIWQGLYDFPLIESESFLNEEDLLYEITQRLRSEFVVEEISPPYEHLLSHQKIHAKFIRIRSSVPENYPGNLTPADASDREKVPKPVLISRYLNDHNF